MEELRRATARADYIFPLPQRPRRPETPRAFSPAQPVGEFNRCEGRRAGRGLPVTTGRAEKTSVKSWEIEAASAARAGQ